MGAGGEDAVPPAPLAAAVLPVPPSGRFDEGGSAFLEGAVGVGPGPVKGARRFGTSFFFDVIMRSVGFVLGSSSESSFFDIVH